MDQRSAIAATEMMSDSASNVLRNFDKANLILFISQVLLLFIVVLTSLINLSLEHGNTNLWTMILTSCIGYMLPNPRLKVSNESKGPASQINNIVQDGDGFVSSDTAFKRTVVEKEHTGNL